MGFRVKSQTEKAVQGFSLLELLVVLSILGLIMSVVLVSLPGSRESLDLKLAARNVMGQMTESRNQAIKSRNDARFFLDMGQGTFWTEGEGSPQKLPEGVEVEIYTAKAEQGEGTIAAIRFFPDGSSTGGYVRLTSPSASYRVAVNWLTGKIVMEHENKQD